LTALLRRGKREKNLLPSGGKKEGMEERPDRGRRPRSQHCPLEKEANASHGIKRRESFANLPTLLRGGSTVN